RQRRIEHRHRHRVERDKRIQEIDCEIVGLDGTGNDSDQHSAQCVRSDEEEFFRQPVHIDADERTEHDGWNRMKESNDGGFYRRASNRIHEPEKGKVRDTVANLGHQLTEPDQSKISPKKQAPVTQRAGLFLCRSVVPRRISVDPQSLPRPHPSLSILTLSVLTAFTPGTCLAASAASNTITWKRTMPLSETT